MRFSFPRIRTSILPYYFRASRWAYLIIGIVVTAQSMAIFPPAAHADSDKNNKFGIHLAQPSDKDIDRAGELVNSTGGRWGYVTIVIHEDDRDVPKWQGIFDKLRERSLIPIIRLATQPEGNNWRAPKAEDARAWVTFLNKLRWVVQKRYIILFNEPNHATEWGGEVRPQEYARVVKEYARAFQNGHPDYFVMPAGLDLAAPSQPPRYESAAVFYNALLEEIAPEEFASLFDGIASHAYPNPGFAGSPHDSGRTSIRGYDWELGLLRDRGVASMPVAITETGWSARAVGNARAAEYMADAYRRVWLPDERVFAVTPFILNYQGEPFLPFSWVTPGEDGVYPIFERIKSAAKVRGVPPIHEQGSILGDFPTEIVRGTRFHFQIELINEGQGIWEDVRGYDLVLISDAEDPFASRIDAFGAIRPGERKRIDVHVMLNDALKRHDARFVLRSEGEEIIRSEPWVFDVVAAPSLEISTWVAPKLFVRDFSLRMQIFDEFDEMVYEQRSVPFTSQVASVSEIENIALGRPYRVVLLRPDYLPRQEYVIFAREHNQVRIPPPLPLDPDGDGALTWGDVPTFFTDIRYLGNMLPW